MAERGWTQQVLAIILGTDQPGIANLVAGKKTVTAGLAIILEEIFGVPADDFLALQRQYDLAKAKIEVIPDPRRATRAHLFGGLPIGEMIERGWITAESVRDTDRVEAELTRFFEVSSLDEIEILPHATKKTDTFSPATPAQLAWFYRVREIASEMLVARYSPAGVRSAIAKLHNLLGAPEEARKAPRILAECGIRYVVVESLSKAKVDGVCFWLNDLSPVIGMSLRFDRNDNYWFVLRHELEHVLRRHGRTAIMLDAELEGPRAGTGQEIAGEERVANEAAAEFCVPQKSMDSFIARKAPFFDERDFLGMAATLSIHPGLIAGQLQHRTGRYDRFRQHLASIRFAVLPTAMHDGWGDIAPVGI